MSRLSKELLQPPPSILTKRGPKNWPQSWADFEQNIGLDGSWHPLHHKLLHGCTVLCQIQNLCCWWCPSFRQIAHQISRTCCQIWKMPGEANLGIKSRVWGVTEKEHAQSQEETFWDDQNLHTKLNRIIVFFSD